MDDKRLKEGRPSKSEYAYLFAVAGVVIITAACIILFYFGVKRYDGLRAACDKAMTIILPFIIGVVLAYLINPIMKFFEKRFSNFFLPRVKPEKAERTKKSIRLFSSIIGLLIVVGVIVAFFMVIIPQMISTVSYLLDHLKEQIEGVLDWANMITMGNYEDQIMGAKNDLDIDMMLDTVVAYGRKYLKLTEEEALIAVVTSGIINVGRLFIDLFIGIIVSVYILVDKERFKGQVKKILYGWFKPAQANVIVDIVRKADDIFYGFIIGKIIDSIIIGFICYFVMLILHMPYCVLCSVIIGVTNIIPVFGPYIGAVPTVIIIFLTSPMQGIYFLIFVVILQQVDGNIIGPKILGDSTGLSSFWVVLAIVVGGGLFGLFGMLLGVPTMALIYYICGRIAAYFVGKRNLPTESDAYVDVKYVDEKTNQPVIKSSEERARSHSKVFKNKKASVKKAEPKADDNGQ